MKTAGCVAAMVLACIMPVHADEIIEVMPEIRTDTEIRFLEPNDSVIAIPLEPRAEPPREKKADIPVLRLEIDDTPMVGKPFTVRLRIYDKWGLPLVPCHDVVTFECAAGVLPVVSRASWRHGLLEDTLVILKPGRNQRLTAMAGDAMAVRHVDVQSEPLTREKWLAIAEEHLSEGRFNEAVAVLIKVSMFEPYGDSTVERRIAGLYLSRGKWKEAEEHYKRALRAVTGSHTK